MYLTKHFYFIRCFALATALAPLAMGSSGLNEIEKRIFTTMVNKLTTQQEGGSLVGSQANLSEWQARSGQAWRSTTTSLTIDDPIKEKANAQLGNPQHGVAGYLTHNFDEVVKKVKTAHAKGCLLSLSALPASPYFYEIDRFGATFLPWYWNGGEVLGEDPAYIENQKEAIVDFFEVVTQEAQRDDARGEEARRFLRQLIVVMPSEVLDPILQRAFEKHEKARKTHWDSLNLDRVQWLLALLGLDAPHQAYKEDCRRLAYWQDLAQGAHQRPYGVVTMAHSLRVETRLLEADNSKQLALSRPSTRPSPTLPMEREPVSPSLLEADADTDHGRVIDAFCKASHPMPAITETPRYRFVLGFLAVAGTIAYLRRRAAHQPPDPAEGTLYEEEEDSEAYL